MMTVHPAGSFISLDTFLSHILCIYAGLSTTHVIISADIVFYQLAQTLSLAVCVAIIRKLCYDSIRLGSRFALYRHIVCNTIVFPLRYNPVMKFAPGFVSFSTNFFGIFPFL